MFRSSIRVLRRSGFVLRGFEMCIRLAVARRTSSTVCARVCPSSILRFVNLCPQLIKPVVEKNCAMSMVDLLRICFYITFEPVQKNKQF